MRDKSGHRNVYLRDGVKPFLNKITTFLYKAKAADGGLTKKQLI